jgi:hypothetical protein
LYRQQQQQVLHILHPQPWSRKLNAIEHVHIVWRFQMLFLEPVTPA